MIRLANILIFIITFGLIGFICYDLYSIKPFINSDELAILRGNFDKKGRLITKRKFNKIYNKVTIDSLEALKLSNSIIEALDFQANLLSNSNTKKYKIGSLKIDRNQLITTSNSLKKMILNKTIQSLKDSFQFYQLKGFDKKGNVKFTGYYIPEVKASLTPTNDFKTPVYSINNSNSKEIIGYIASKSDLNNIKLQGSGYLKFNDSRQLIGYSGKLKKENQVIDSLQTDEVDVDDDLIESSIKSEIEVENNNECFVKLDDKPCGAGIVPLTNFCSIAVDRRYIPLGSCLLAAVPIIDENGNILHHKYSILLAQDIGGAVIGKGHIDFYHGIGEEAGMKATKLNHYGQLWLILPKDQNKN